MAALGSGASSFGGRSWGGGAPASSAPASSSSTSSLPRRIVVNLRAAATSSASRAPASSPAPSPTNHRFRPRPSGVRGSAATSGNHPPSQQPTDITCVGEALFDLIADQKGLPRDQVKSWTAYPGGAPCNVATAAARLGATSAFVSALGRDAPGNDLLSLLSERKVDVSQVQRPQSAPTRSVYVVRTADGDREFSGFGGPTESYSDCFLDAAALDLRALQQARCVVTGTLGLAYPDSRRAIERVVEAAREAGAVVLVDVNWRPVFWKEEGEGGAASSPSSPRRIILDFLAKHADVVKVSDADLEYLCQGVTCEEALSNPCGLLGGEENSASSSLSSASSLPLPRAAGVLVTAGEKGASYCFRAPNKGAHSGFVPAYDVGVADTTGAGDAFTAGFLWWMLKKNNGGGAAATATSSGRDALRALQADPSALADAVAFGAATGALTCTKPGAIASQPTLEEVMGLFEKAKKGGSDAATRAA